MLDVNLEAGEVKKINLKAMRKSVFVSIAALGLVLLLYTALIFTGKALSSKIEDVKIQNEADYKNFLAGNGNEVIDFKNRNSAARDAVNQSQPASEILSQIESSVLPAVYLESLSYESKNKSMSLKCAGDNFNTEAKQILSFKENNFFSSVAPSNGAYDSKGEKLNFSINLKINTRE